MEPRPGRNEGIHVLEEFVCTAIPGPMLTGTTPRLRVAVETEDAALGARILAEISAALAPRWGKWIELTSANAAALEMLLVPRAVGDITEAVRAAWERHCQPIGLHLPDGTTAHFTGDAATLARSLEKYAQAI